MYKKFFGLRENPFNTNPDPRFLYVTPPIQEALEDMTYGVQNRKGCILLTGEVGTGKTTLVNCFLDWLRHRKMPTAFIFNSHLSVKHLFDFILTDFGIAGDFGLKSNMLLQLTAWLMERFRAGETPVLIVDEAQGLSFELLEEVRLLLNLETASEKLLQIVLVGQPELEEKLKLAELRQFRQRISLRCNTAPLSLEQTCGYIANRLRIGGAAGNAVFAPAAMEAVHFHSGGIPRVINHLCEHALINAYVEECNPVQARIVEEAARGFLLDEYRPAASSPGGDKYTNGNHTVLQTNPAPEAANAFRTELESAPQLHHSNWSPAERMFAIEELGLSAATDSGEAGLEFVELSSSPERKSEAASVNHSNSTLPGRESEQSVTASFAESIEQPSETAALFLSELKRVLGTASTVASLQVVPARAGNQSATPVKVAPLASSKIREFTLNSINQLPGHSQQSSRSGQQISSKKWERIRMKQLFAGISVGKWMNDAYGLWRGWARDFKRDWNAMMESVLSTETKRNLLRWLRQPMSSKSIGTSKN